MRQLQPEEILITLDLAAKAAARSEGNHPIDQLEGQAAELIRRLIGELAELHKHEEQAFMAVNALMRQNDLLRDSLMLAPPQNVN